ncbi:hypothetical protein VQ042_10485 [Aurantimonas sp. A2-1-M11]|uniref:hypothetical protein n=1 Tax=Aurantimonas sp. A2-1-M11 TaxID=3113712 RepID=UPI002F95AA04
MTAHFDCHPADSRLRAAARNYVEARRRDATRDLSRLELAALLRRFDLEPGSCDGAIAADDAALIPQRQRRALQSRLAVHLRLQARLARRGDPGYDIGRHMALKRLARWLDGTAPWYAEPAPIGSGRAANARFRRSIHPRRMPQRKSATVENRNERNTDADDTKGAIV